MESPEYRPDIGETPDGDPGPMATTECPRCRRPLAAPPELAGLVVECAHCRFRFVAPALEAGAAPNVLAVETDDEPRPGVRRAPPQTIAMLLGSACGLILGYYLLNFLWGSQFDLLRVPLPGVDHTRQWSAQRAAPATSAHSGPAAAPTPAAATPSAPPADEGVVQAVAIETPDAAAVEAAAPAASGDTSEVEPPGRLPSMVAARPLATGKPLAGGPPVRGAKLVSPERLKAALADMERLAGCRRCKSTGRIQRTAVTVTKRGAKAKPVETTAVCDECGGLAAARMSPEIYQALCDVAEAACFVEVRGADAALDPERQKLQALLLRMSASREKANDLGRMASLWLDNSQREGVGIALAGTVQRVRREGKLWRCDILIFGRPRMVTVLAPHDGGFHEKDRVVVLGAVVDHPRYNLTGYDGDATQVVWGGLPLRLPES